VTEAPARGVERFLRRSDVRDRAATMPGWTVCGLLPTEEAKGYPPRVTQSPGGEAAVVSEDGQRASPARPRASSGGGSRPAALRDPTFALQPARGGGAARRNPRTPRSSGSSGKGAALPGTGTVRRPRKGERTRRPSFQPCAWPWLHPLPFLVYRKTLPYYHFRAGGVHQAMLASTRTLCRGFSAASSETRRQWTGFLVEVGRGSCSRPAAIARSRRSLQAKTIVSFAFFNSSPRTGRLRARRSSNVSVSARENSCRICRHGRLFLQSLLGRSRKGFAGNGGSSASLECRKHEDRSDRADWSVFQSSTYRSRCCRLEGFTRCTSSSSV